MLALIYLAVLGAVLGGFVAGIKYSARAIRGGEHRLENSLRAAGGFLVVAVITYPLALGPLVARVACASGVGLEVTARVDLRSNGYLIDWPDNIGKAENIGEGFMPYAVEDLLDGRIAFFETSSFYRDGSLQRVALGQDDSRDCINPGDLMGKRRLPKGMCLEVQRVVARESKYDIETSHGYWETEHFQKSIALVEHADDRTTASYKVRRIPGAELSFVSGDGAAYCPRDGTNSRSSPWYALTADALTASESSAGGIDAAANAENYQPQCVLPPLPENVEVHRYSGYRGRERIDLQLDNSGSMAMENFVYVNRPGVPVVLMLGNDHPVLWRIRQTPDSQIVAVLAEGPGSAVAVTGVKADVPLLISSTNYGRMTNCRSRELGAILEKLRIQFRSEIDSDKNYMRDHEMSPFVVGPKLSESAYVEYDDIPESRYTFRKGMPAGDAGIEYLISTGAARLLTQEDSQSLRQRKLPLATAVGRSAERPAFYVGGNVILLRATRLPGGVNGRMFIIPRGVPAPSPPLGQNQFLKVDAECTVSPCRY